MSFREGSKHNEVLNYNNDDYFPLLSYVTTLQTINKRDHDDEVRKPMIIKQLNQLTQKRFEIIQDNVNLSTDNKKSIEDNFDLKIMLLQGELNKLTREEEMLKINRYSSASNNPYFSVYNPRAAHRNQHLKRESSPENVVVPHNIPMDVTDSPYKSDIKSF